MSACRRGEPEIGGGAEARVTMSTVHSPLQRYCRMEALQVDLEEDWILHWTCQGWARRGVGSTQVRLLMTFQGASAAVAVL